MNVDKNLEYIKKNSKAELARKLIELEEYVERKKLFDKKQEEKLQAKETELGELRPLKEQVKALKPLNEVKEKHKIEIDGIVKKYEDQLKGNHMLIANMGHTIDDLVNLMKDHFDGLRITNNFAENIFQQTMKEMETYLPKVEKKGGNK